MAALEPFRVTLTFCFTPEHLGVQRHHTSRPQRLEQYAEFCAEMVRRYAPGVQPDIIPFPQQTALQRKIA